MSDTLTKFKGDIRFIKDGEERLASNLITQEEAEAFKSKTFTITQNDIDELDEPTEEWLGQIPNNDNPISAAAVHTLLNYEIQNLKQSINNEIKDPLRDQISNLENRIDEIEEALEARIQTLENKCKNIEE